MCRESLLSCELPWEITNWTCREGLAILTSTTKNTTKTKTKHNNPPPKKQSIHLKYYISIKEAYKLFDFPHLIRNILFNSSDSSSSLLRNTHSSPMYDTENMYSFFSMKYTLNRNSTCTETHPSNSIMLVLGNYEQQNPQIHVN